MALRSGLRLLALGLAIALGAMAVRSAARVRQQAQADRVPPPSAARTLARLGRVPDFKLTDQDRHPFGREQLLGHVWVANFIFTRCPMVCPRFTAQMAALGKATAGSSRRTALQLVSFSVDPAYDSPARLRAYGERYQADFSRWAFLTGPTRAVRAAVVDGLKMEMDGAGANAANPDALVHGTRFVLVDGTGEIRGYYASGDPEALLQLAADAEALAGAVDGAGPGA